MQLPLTHYYEHKVSATSSLCLKEDGIPFGTPHALWERDANRLLSQEKITLGSKHRLAATQ